MQKQSQPMSCSPPSSNQGSTTRPSMACQQGSEPTGRSPGGASATADDDVHTRTGAEDHRVSSAPADDFEFCILSSGGLALAAGDDAADMCVADEVFSGGKLLPLRLSSATSADASSALLLLRSDSLATAASASTSSSGSSSGSVSRSSSSGCVSRSTSSKSASASDHAGPGSSSSSNRSASSATVPPRRSLSGSVFYAHPSPSPRLPRRRARSASAARRSTGSAPPASWGVIRLGVVGAPEVYAPRPAEHRKTATARSGRFEQHQHRTVAKEPAPADKKLALGLLGAGLACSCSPDAVAPVGSAEVAATAARRRRKKAEEKKRAAKQGGNGKGTARRNRILEWLEELSISKEKSAAAAPCR